ncbi:hypothetical protein NF556_16465 [Ornithinimicrobium faecis]|uniref:Uncharacterized protein n=1 Tax=Ornithinimicrobium faecis TaxID=2934158 RepID=A0ABY4YR12_9MICO|nr:hypothetical protein [Ornithinimicrobium sp. HY1793]USQ79195.1 hypothetical protein NF556_16465 [Ornithinimicrobium sp. HY1793]
MRFAIPKGLPQNSLITENVINVELNDTDVDRMMTKILERAVKRGRVSGSKVDTKDYEGYLAKLQGSPHLTGVEGERGLEVLDGWIRSSVLVQETAGLRRDTVQMGYLMPLTVAAYRSGLPRSQSRNRKADALVYKVTARALRDRGESNESAVIQRLFLDTFGRGVELGPFPSTNPAYDGSEVDIDTLLALRFIEQFTGNEAHNRELDRLDPPVPSAVDPIARDLLEFLTFYGPKLPVAEAYTHFSALLSLRLFQLPIVTARVIRALLSGELPPSSARNPCAQYVDFVRRRGHPSDELSRMSVQRDLEVMRTFFGDRLLLRSLQDAVPLLPTRPDLGETAAAQLAGLAAMQDDPMMQMALKMQVGQIEGGLAADDEGRSFIAELRDSHGLSAAHQLTAILVEGLRKRGLENQVKWFHSAGGIKKSYGLLKGELRSRSSWRYSLSDESLVALLCMLFVDESGQRTTSRLPIREVLARLEERFGLLIASPPPDLDSADARAGAAENLSAFTQRMKLLGCFEGLSDDFSAQFVTRPREAV